MQNMPQLPQYQSHKKVRAAKITAIKGDGHDDPVLVLEGVEGSVIPDASFFGKHEPEVGGYYVVYEDGYQSYSPAEAFENGYTLVEAQGAAA